MMMRVAEQEYLLKNIRKLCMCSVCSTCLLKDSCEILFDKETPCYWEFEVDEVEDDE